MIDRPTVSAYEAGASWYLQERRAYAPDAARALRDEVGPGALIADLGCGPGHYLPHLGEPVVALDAAHAMLASTGPSGLRVQADLADLPLRDGCLAGAWASKCYQHLPHEHLPAALADLHRATAPRAPVAITVFAGTGTEVTDAEDDLPGRRFSLWDPDHLADVVVGAGFEVQDVAVAGDGRFRPLRLTARRARSLADHVGPAMRMLLCGLNPSLYAADVGVNYARPGNRFWPAMSAAGLASVDRDPRHLLRYHGIGSTDLVKRATVAAAEVTAEEFTAGVARVERLCEWLRPGVLYLVGLQGWRSAVDRKAKAGLQPQPLGGVPVYVGPSTSGLNASTQLPGHVEHLRAAATVADARRR